MKKGYDGQERHTASWDLRLKDWTWFSLFDDDGLIYLAAKDWNNNLRFEHGVRPKAKK